MADLFDARLKMRLQESGGNSGQWGTLLNQTVTNIASVFGFGTHQLTSDANATLTLSDDGASLDALKSSYLKITSSVSLTATRTLTFAPNTFNQVKYIENATTGSQSLVIKQGSGATVTVASGKTAVLYFDGAGSGAAVVDALAGVDPGVTDTLAEVLAAGNATGGTDIAVGTGDDVTFADSSKAIFGAGPDLQIHHDGSNSYIEDSGTGALFFKTNYLALQGTNGHQIINAEQGGAVELYHANSRKLLTTSSGIDVTGSVTATGDVESKGGNELRVYRTDNNAYASLEYLTGFGGLNITDGNGDGITFSQTGSGTVGMFNAGNFLVGKTTTAFGTAGVRIDPTNIQVTTSGATVAYFNRLSSNGTIVDFYKDSSSVGSIGSVDGAPYYAGTAKALRIGTAGFYPATNTGAYSDGTVDLGYASGRFKDAFIMGLDVTASTNNRIVSYFSGSYISGFKFSDLNGGIWYDAGTDDLTVSAGHANSQLILVSGGSEAGRFDSSQNFLVGKTATTQTTAGTVLYNNGQIYATANEAQAQVLTRTSTDGKIQIFYKDSAEVGFIGSNAATGISFTNLFSANSGVGTFLHQLASGAGNADLRYATSTGFVTFDTSSRLVKEEIEDIPYGLEAIKQLSPKKYRRTDGENDLELGLIADEVVEVIPELVGIMSKSVFTKDESDTEQVAGSVRYSKLTAVLVKAIQEQQTLIESLTDRIAALENN